MKDCAPLARCFPARVQKQSKIWESGVAWLRRGHFAVVGAGAPVRQKNDRLSIAEEQKTAVFWGKTVGVAGLNTGP